MRKPGPGELISLLKTDLIETPEGAVMTVEELFRWMRRVAGYIKKCENREWSEKFEEPGVRINIKLSWPSEIDKQVQAHVAAVKKLLVYLENPNQESMDFGS